MAKKTEEEQVSKEDQIRNALLGIEKHFGKGAVMRMGDKPEVDMEVISTQSLKIDAILGVGGFPKGRIIEIMGPEASGKCLSEDSYIQTTNGFKTVAEIFEGEGLPLHIKSVKVECAYPLINRYGDVEHTTHFTYNGRKKVNEIETQSGFKYKRTHKHPLMTMSRFGNLVWKWAGEIEVGDYVVNHRKTFFGSKKVPKDTCYAIGALIADGGLSANVSISNDDPCIKKFIEERMARSLGFGYTRIRDNSCSSEDSKMYTFGIYEQGERRDGRKLQEEFYDKFDLKRCVSREKVFPEWVRELDRESMAELIRGYIDCEGHIDAAGLEVISASYELMYQFKLMLSQFGITSFMRERKNVKGYEHNHYYRLNIYSEDFELYIDQIGTNSKYREKQISVFLDSRSHISEPHTNYKHIPFIKELAKDLYHQQENRTQLLGMLTDGVNNEVLQMTHTRLKRILGVVEPNDLSRKLESYLEYTFDKVVSNEKLEEGIRTFDFSMEKTHSFTADGCINHNTSLTLHTISSLQKSGGTAAFIDAEHALDPVYARALGVDTDSLILSQPDNGEQALEILDKLIDTKLVDLIIVDSVAALVPKAELEGEMGDNQMGLQARLMSKAMRKITGKVKTNNVTVIFINQIRNKIGVMFGCFHYRSKVLLEDGTKMCIGKIVSQKLDVKVMSYNEKTGKIEPKRVVNHFNHGKAGKFYNLVVDYPGDSGKSQLIIGDDHKFPTPQGERMFSDMKVGDELYVKRTNYLGGELEDFILGMVLGDSSMRTKNGKTISLRSKHAESQNEYCKWKMGNFPKDYISCSGYDNKNQFWFDCKNTEENFYMKKYKSGSAIRFLDKEVVDKITVRTLAIWYLDDGTLSGSYARWGKGKSVIYATKMDKDSKKLVLDRFEYLGLKRPTSSKAGFMMTSDVNYSFQEAIVKFVPKSMSYKILPELRHLCIADEITPPKSKAKDVLVVSQVTEIRDRGYRPWDRATSKFDIEVEGNHNYFVDNVLVHNSNETTSGGNALKFFASVRVDIRKSTQIKDGEEVIGNKTKIKIIKNKVAPPFRTAEVDILYGIGIDLISELLDIAIEVKIVKQSGSWFSYGESRLGQGRASVIDILKDNPELCEELKSKIGFKNVEVQE